MERRKRDELTCIFCLAVGTMCLINGYDTQAFIVESVLHSVHKREPARIDKHAGYYGQAVLYAAYAIATLLAPWICYRVGSKWSLFGASILFTIYQVGFFMLNSYYYYISQALMGIGFALYFSGQGLYLSEHSTRSTITRNSSLVSSIGSSIVLGGVVLIIIFYIQKRISTESGSLIEHVELDYRNFSTAEIYVVYGALLCFTLFSNIIFALMPVRKTTDSEMEAVEKLTLRTQLGDVSNPQVLLKCTTPNKNSISKEE